MANLQKGVLDKVENYLSRQDYEFEVIIVDDGSNDGSCEFAKEFANNNKNVRLIENNHTGKAGAVTTGMLSAKGDYILFTDMDQATPIQELSKLIPFTRDFDIVMGSRSRRKDAPWSRQIMSKSQVLLRKIIVGLPLLHDTQCGFKLFSKKAASEIFSEIQKIHHGYSTIHGSSVTSGFDVELLYIGQKNGYTIKEVPVNWLYVESRRVSPLRDSVGGVIDLIRIRRNIMKGKYG